MNDMAFERWEKIGGVHCARFGNAAGSFRTVIRNDVEKSYWAHVVIAEGGTPKEEPVISDAHATAAYSALNFG